MARYRAGIIGCGSMGRAHATAWAGVPDVELAALADTYPGARADLAGTFSVRSEHCYADYRQMLDAENLDIVSICSWHGQHAEMAIAAAARSPRVILCEKPMALSLGEADMMITAAGRANVKLAISHMRRFYTGWEEARRRVAAGEIGTPRRAWTIVREGLLNWGTHTIDGLRYVLGDPLGQWVIGNVERKTDRYERGTRIEDACAGICGLAGNIHVTIESDLTSEGSINFEITGSEGILQVDENSVRLLSSRGTGWHDLHPEQNEPFTSQAQGIVDWLDGKVGPLEFRNEATHGRAALEIMMAIYESARCHEIVRLPLATRVSPLDIMVESGDLPVQRPGAYDIRSFLVRGEGMSWR